MITKIQYNNLEERQQIIDANQDNFLIEEQNILDGNFLIFTDIKPVEYQLRDQADNQLVIMDVLATMYEDMLAKGTV